MNDFICSVCNYSLIIQKNVISNVQLKEYKIANPEKFLQVVQNIQNNNIMNEFDIKLQFMESDLQNYIKKNRLDSSTQQKLLKVFQNIINQKKQQTNYIKQCTGCDEKYNLEPGTIIYSTNMNKQTNSFNDENIDLKICDQTLPRTKDYICQNNNCITNTVQENDDNYIDIMIQKEAVFYRGIESYNLKYACCVCKTSWNV